MLSFFGKIFHRIIGLLLQLITIIFNAISSFPPLTYIGKLVRAIHDSAAFKSTCSFLNKYSLLFHIPLSLLITFYMESFSRHSLSEGLLFVTEHTKPFLYNSYVVFTVLTLVYLVKRKTVARIVITGIFMALGTINGVILSNRVTPFGFVDLYMIGDLLTMKNTTYFTSRQAAFYVFIVVTFTIIMIVWATKGAKQPSKLHLSIRLILIIGTFITLPFSTNLLQQKNILASYFGNLAQGYLDYGFLYGFNMSIFRRGMDKPFLYGEDSVANIINKTQKGESEITGEDGPNVVIMLLESFYDVSETDFIKTSSDPIPYFRSLMQDYSSGFLTVPVVGAGTCNSEFEVLTGMSCQFFGPGEYPQKTILKEVSSCESIADTFKRAGYGTHVVHNNGGNFYSRKNAFSLMGFDTFTSKELLDITEWTPLGTWPTDDILIEATKDSMDSTPQRDFVYTITVQAHGNYPMEKVLEYPSIEVECEGKSEENRLCWEYYINMLNREDNFLRRYMKMLEERDEPTLVIMFGDHLPTMGLSADEQSTGDLFVTNYATWNNFDMDKKDADLTSYQLASEYMNRLGIHGGTLVDYNQTMTDSGINPRSLRYTNGIHTLQYDLLYGKRYAYKGEDKYPATDIKMGIKPVKIDRTYAFNGSLHIYGENFTPWSSVLVGEETIPTTYRSGQCLTVNLKDLDDGDVIRVGQMGSGNTIFRSSNRVVYRTQ